jgi:superfamily II DNA or RNA helicase
VETVSETAVVTVGDALISLQESSFEPPARDVNMEAIFTSNERMIKMNATLYGPGVFGADEVTRYIDRRGLEKQLNPSQLAALKEAIHKPVTLIQGPPGTGKTRTACKASTKYYS